MPYIPLTTDDGAGRRDAPGRKYGFAAGPGSTEGVSLGSELDPRAGAGEFGLTVHAYKIKHHRPFPTYSEVFRGAAKSWLQEGLAEGAAAVRALLLAAGTLLTLCGVCPRCASFPLDGGCPLCVLPRPRRWRAFRRWVEASNP
jgi:hypothetical protein